VAASDPVPMSTSMYAGYTTCVSGDPGSDWAGNPEIWCASDGNGKLAAAGATAGAASEEADVGLLTVLLEC